VDSFWSAWDAFTTAASYREAVVRAVAYGGDTDTTAAIAGGLAGAHWGIEAIPSEWRAGLRERSIVRPLLDALIGREGWLTSTGHPLRLDTLGLSGVDGLAGSGGRVSLTFLPGKRRDGVSGRHWRDLETDAATLRVGGVSALALFVEDRELAWCRVETIGEVLAAHDVELLRFPIDDDLGRPEDPVAYAAFVRGLLARVRAGQHLVLACRGGLDRTGMTAGCLLVEGGTSPDDAIGRVHRARPGALTRPDQQAIVRGWAAARSADPC
jgi:protein-tyrosine phosphatase